MISSRLLLTYEKGRDGLFKSFKCLTKELTHKNLQKNKFVIIEVRFYHERGLSNGRYLLQPSESFPHFCVQNLDHACTKYAILVVKMDIQYLYLCIKIPIEHLDLWCSEQADFWKNMLKVLTIGSSCQSYVQLDRVPVSVSEWLLGSFVLILRRAP